MSGKAGGKGGKGLAKGAGKGANNNKLLVKKAGEKIQQKLGEKIGAPKPMKDMSDMTCWEYKKTGVCPRGGPGKCKWDHNVKVDKAEVYCPPASAKKNTLAAVNGQKKKTLAEVNLPPPMKNAHLSTQQNHNKAKVEGPPSVYLKHKGGEKGAGKGESKAVGSNPFAFGNRNSEKSKKGEQSSAKGNVEKGAGKKGDGKGKGNKGGKKGENRPPLVGPNGESADDPTCWDFVKGTCKRGDRCKWLHEIPQ